MRLMRVDQVNMEKEMTLLLSRGERPTRSICRRCETNAVLVVYKRREIKRCLRGCHVDVAPVGWDELFVVEFPAR